jgi:hypothetical protein
MILNLGKLSWARLRSFQFLILSAAVVAAAAGGEVSGLRLSLREAVARREAIGMMLKGMPR